MINIIIVYLWFAEIDIGVFEFKREVVKLFPALENVEFEILRSVAGGHGKPVVRILQEQAIPSVRDISTIAANVIVALISILK